MAFLSRDGRSRRSGGRQTAVHAARAGGRRSRAHSIRRTRATSRVRGPTIRSVVHPDRPACETPRRESVPIRQEGGPSRPGLAIPQSRGSYRSRSRCCGELPELERPRNQDNDLGEAPRGANLIELRTLGPTAELGGNAAAQPNGFELSSGEESDSVLPGFQNGKIAHSVPGSCRYSSVPIGRSHRLDRFLVDTVTTRWRPSGATANPPYLDGNVAFSED